MNKYLHAVGFAIGLVSVILLSVLDGACMRGREEIGWSLLYVNKTTYSLLWLFSYILTAVTTGEFIVNAKIRKYIFLPFLCMFFTAGYFFSLFATENQVLCAVFCFLNVAGNILIIVFTVKNTRFFFAGVLVNCIWYAYLFGVSVIRIFF